MSEIADLLSGMTRLDAAQGQALPFYQVHAPTHNEMLARWLERSGVRMSRNVEDRRGEAPIDVADDRRWGVRGPFAAPLPADAVSDMGPSEEDMRNMSLRMNPLSIRRRSRL